MVIIKEWIENEELRFLRRQKRQWSFTRLTQACGVVEGIAIYA
jgi:hypothetical protein